LRPQQKGDWHARYLDCVGCVLALPVEVGENAADHDEIELVEAMKMEISAPLSYATSPPMVARLIAAMHNMRR
jgi:pyruvate carboxylase